MSPPGPTCADGQVTLADAAVMTSHLGRSGVDLPGDLNRDGRVGVIDLVLLRDMLGSTCQNPAPAAAVDVALASEDAHGLPGTATEIRATPTLRASRSERPLGRQRLRVPRLFVELG